MHLLCDELKWMLRKRLYKLTHSFEMTKKKAIRTPETQLSKNISTIHDLILLQALQSIYPWKGMFFLITCFIEYFDVRWREMRPPCKKTTITSWVSWGCRVRGTASGVGVLVVSRVVVYGDIMTTPSAKGGSTRMTSVHCILLISVLCQLYGIVSFDVIEREDESSIGVGISARTSWNRRTMYLYIKKLEENINPRRKGGGGVQFLSWARRRVFPQTGDLWKGGRYFTCLGTETSTKNSYGGFKGLLWRKASEKFWDLKQMTPKCCHYYMF